jgi:hypothetical protein
MRRYGAAAVCTAALCLFSISCGKKGENWGYALASGTYDLTGPFCASTGLSPAYKDIARRINLFDFTSTIQQSLIIEAYTTRRVISDPDCRLTIDQPIDINRESTFAQKIARKFVFEPDGCTLTVSADSKAFEAGRQSSDAFADSENTGMDIPYEIQPIENTPDSWQMISADNETLNAVWGDYGCSVPDRVKWILTRKPDT